MKNIQYTLRNIPEPVDRYLRKRARLSGKSLNQTVIDELSEKSGAGKNTLLESLDWFIGSNTIDEASVKAIEDMDREQKEKIRKEWEDTKK